LISVAGEYQRRYRDRFHVRRLSITRPRVGRQREPVGAGAVGERRKAAASGLSISSGLSVSSASAMGSVPSGRWSPPHSPPTPRERVNELEDHVARDDRPRWRPSNSPRRRPVRATRNPSATEYREPLRRSRTRRGRAASPTPRGRARQGRTRVDRPRRGCPRRRWPPSLTSDPPRIREAV